MSRTYWPKITTLDGSDSFELTNPDYRPLLKFDVRHSRRHKPETVPRRDGAKCFLSGPLGVMEIHLQGSIGSADLETNETIRDTFSGRFMRQDETFYLYKYTDRRAKVRIESSEWPEGRVVVQEVPYDLHFIALDPYWYDLEDSSSTQDVVLNGPGADINIGGSMPTPVRMEITMPAGETCDTIRMEDVNLNARTGRGYWEFGDETCQANVGGTNIEYDPRDDYRTIETDNGDCTNPLERFNGYFFSSGPGITTFELTTPGTALDSTAQVTFTWRNRWLLP